MSIYLNERKDQRNDMSKSIMFSRKGGNESFTAKVINCSENGVSFLSDYPYINGTEIDIKAKEDNDPFLVSVKWSKPHFDEHHMFHGYIIGAEFNESI